MDGVIPADGICELAAALAKAQAALKPAAQDRDNPHLKSRYATLTSVWDACREALTENGLCVVQIPTSAEAGWISLETRLMHSSGQQVVSMFSAPVPENRGVSPLQAYGSALTYMRRYALAAVVGVVADEDNDGHGEPKKAAPAQQQRQEPAPQQQRPPESSGDRAATNGDGLESARLTFAAVLLVAAPEVEDNPRLRNAFLTELIGKPITTCDDWDVKKYAAATSRLKALDAMGVLDVMRRAQDRLQDAPELSAQALGA